LTVIGEHPRIYGYSVPMSSPENADAIEALLAGEPLARVADVLRELIRPAILARTGDKPVSDSEPAEPPDASQFGGVPRLPMGIAWPRGGDAPDAAPLPFVARIRLRDVAGMIPDSPLPETGWLSFFFSQAVLFSHLLNRAVTIAGLRDSAVLYFDGDSTRLRTADIPADLAPNDRYPTYRTVFAPALMLPRVETCFLGEQANPRNERVLLTRDEWLFYADETHSDAGFLGNTSHLLGYSQNAQPGAMEASYLYYRSHHFGELPAWDSLTPEEQLREHEGNCLLLQVEPFTGNAYFGRGGALYFFIRYEDMNRRDFSRAWAWVQ